MSQSVMQDGRIFVGKSVKPEYLDLALANRHGLITGATGTGKTVTLQILAEGFSQAGVPVFAADIKGDLSGIAAKGEPSIVQRAMIRPPQGRIGPLSDAQRRTLISSSALYSKYEEVKDRESAHEMLQSGAEEAAEEVNGSSGGWFDSIFGGTRGPTGRRRQGMWDMISREMQRSISRTIVSTIKGIILKSIRGR
jgi:hypothetical protein